MFSFPIFGSTLPRCLLSSLFLRTIWMIVSLLRSEGPPPPTDCRPVFHRFLASPPLFAHGAGLLLCFLLILCFFPLVLFVLLPPPPVAMMSAAVSCSFESRLVSFFPPFCLALLRQFRTSSFSSSYPRRAATTPLTILPGGLLRLPPPHHTRHTTHATFLRF